MSAITPLSLNSPRYPFVAVEGHPGAKRALLLLAVEPELRGALIASVSGSAKSVLARAFASIYPTTHPISLESSTQDHQFYSRPIELPIGVTEDRLLGGLDLERTLATGRRQVSRGLLARAHGEVLYVDSVNLLEPVTATHLANALDYRRVQVERESVSASHSADFVLVATFNPAEGDAASLLRDRIGLIVEEPDDVSTEERGQIIERGFRFERDPAGFAKDFEVQTAQLNQSIGAARRRLPRVKVSQKQRRQIAQLAIMLSVKGNRADVFALKAARANAALSGRNRVVDEDVIVAVQLVLAPRAGAFPSSGDAETRNNEIDSEQPENQQSIDSSPAEIEEVIIAAIDSLVPKDLLKAEQKKLWASRAGKRFKGASSARGRYVRSDARQTREGRIAIDATLRAAAPFQMRRRLAEAAVTLKQTPSAARDGHRVKIEPSDLRYKRFKHRSGVMFIFAVDTSGSMALNRLAQAKGALVRLLGEAYLHRDKVALISFRGDDAQVLLAPTRSVELAKRLVDTMPAGGGTPVSAGVLKAIELARLARHQGMSKSLLVLFTDGRANVRMGHGRTIDEELRQLGALLHADGIASVIVDTKAAYLSRNEGRALANALGSRYVQLPRVAAELIEGTRDFLIGGRR